MNKLEVGMYVRTDKGKIGKFVKEVNDYFELEYQGLWCDLVFKNRCLKASYNIIDLIEAGDYVNGKFVDNTSLGRGKYVFCGTKKVYEIESIVTKEKFESMKYNVGGN